MHEASADVLFCFDNIVEELETDIQELDSDIEGKYNSQSRHNNKIWNSSMLAQRPHLLH